MPEIEVDQLLPIITGVQLKAELGDRPLAYRIEAEAQRLIGVLLPKKSDDEPPRLSAVVLSDVFYLNHEELQIRPMICVGGPGMNMVCANLVEELPSALAIENVLAIQMDMELNDLRCLVWGMDHLATVRAVETFIVKGYLESFVKAVVRVTET